ncbi:MAG: hypothetical protein WAZ20_06230 [Methanothrix sp.]|uniref:hypothetical protein n=2 Tax=Methanothrix sp. TaxID=90426 RepID=UPI003BB687AE
MKARNMKKIICKNCGVVNEISDDAQIEDSDWVECTLPEGFEWVLPAGKITPVIGDPLYISAQGEHLSQHAYLDRYSIDPEISYQLIRGSSRSRSAVMAAAGRRRGPEAISSKGRSDSWLDEDDWIS